MILRLFLRWGSKLFHFSDHISISSRSPEYVCPSFRYLDSNNFWKTQMRFLFSTNPPWCSMLVDAVHSEATSCLWLSSWCYLSQVYAWASVLTSSPSPVIKVFPCGSVVQNPPAMPETHLQSLSWEDHLKEEMATHSSFLAWRISRTEEPGSLQSLGSQRVRCDWETAHTTHPMTRVWYLTKY